MKVIPCSVPSCDGVHDLAGKVYLPDTPPKGIVHILHGMAEHIARYDPFMPPRRTAGSSGWRT